MRSIRGLFKRLACLTTAANNIPTKTGTQFGGHSMARVKFLSAFAFVVVFVCPQWIHAETATNTSITFTKDIAPIFQDKCQACHRADSMAPMSLVTYEEA